MVTMEIGMDKTPEQERAEWVAGLMVKILEVKSDGGVTLEGTPYALSRVCARLGFKNPCLRGRVFITAAKRRWLGL